MASIILSAHEDLALFRDCPCCFWLKHKHRNFPPPSETEPPFMHTAKSAVLEYFDRYRGRVPAYFQGEIGGKLIEDEEKLAEWRSRRKGLTWSDKHLRASLQGWMDDCFLVDGRFHAPAFVSLVEEEPDKEQWIQRHQIVYDAVTFLLQANGLKTEDVVYQFFYVPDAVLKTHGIALSAKVWRVETDAARAERVFVEASELLHRRELPETDPYCAVCKWFQDRVRHTAPSD